MAAPHKDHIWLCTVFTFMIVMKDACEIGFTIELLHLFSFEVFAGGGITAVVSCFLANVLYGDKY